MESLPVSVITTVFNEGASIDAFLDSLASQTRPADEIVIVDAGSTDGMLERLRAAADSDLRLRTQGVADLDFFFGNPGDAPIAGDFNGDGCDTVSIYRASEQRFSIIDHLGDAAAGLGSADYYFTFGNPGDPPFAGDFDGDGIDEVALHRASSGFVYLRYTLDSGVADQQFFYGIPRDVPIAGDWNGDGFDTVAVFRPSDGNWYLKLNNAQGNADHGIHFHNEDGKVTRPVAGYFGAP